MAAVQLSFSLRTSSHCKTVHLLGSWDTYKNMLPLSKDSSVKGGWKGTFRFQGSTLKPGSRYWYYYIVDGYQVSHDSSQPSTKEPTTGRQLNILDVPTKASAPANPPKLDIASAQASTKRQSTTSKRDSTSKRESTSKRNSKRESANIPRGRCLSPSQIMSPKPVKPHETQYVTGTDFTKHEAVEQLSRQFSHARVSSSGSLASSRSKGSSNSSYFETDSSDGVSDNSSDIEAGSDVSSDIDSDVASDVPSLSSSRSGGSSSISSGGSSSRLSPASPASSCSNSSRCTCERYGITRKGDRVKLDCGGSRCGFSSDSCGSDSEFEEDLQVRIKNTRRQGIVVRGGLASLRR